jgi:MFS family permease
LKKRHAVVGLLGGLSVLTFLDRMAISVTAPAIQKDLHIGPAMWGWVLSAYVLAYGLFEIPSGARGDRHGHRGELTRITLWWSVFTAATGWCRGFWQLASARFLFGIGAAGAYPNAAGVLWRWLPARERARGQGVVWACSRLGGALAPLVLVPLEVVCGWRAVFWALAAVGLLWAIVWRRWYRDNPADQPGITQKELDEIGPASHAGAHAGAPWGRLLRLPQLWLIFFAYLFYAWGSWFYYNWFPTWLVHAGHFSVAQMGLYASIPFLLGIVSNLVGGALCDWLGARIGLKSAYRWITAGCLTVTAGLLAAMSLAHDQIAVVALASAGFAAMDLMLPSAWAMCMAIGGPFGGVATGVMNTAGQIGGLMCTVLFGYVVAATGNYELPVQAVALMVLVGAGIFSLIDCTRGFGAKANEADALASAPAAGDLEEVL